MKELVAIVIVSCTGIGAVVGGTLNAVDDYRYHSALESSTFTYLVDEAGNPVSKQIKKHD